MTQVLIEKIDEIFVITLNRPDVRNAVDFGTAEQLAHAIEQFDHDPLAKVAVLCGAGGTFCAGADLKAISAVCTHCKQYILSLG